MFAVVVSPMRAIPRYLTPAGTVYINRLYSHAVDPVDVLNADHDTVPAASEVATPNKPDGSVSLIQADTKNCCPSHALIPVALTVVRFVLSIVDT